MNKRNDCPASRLFDDTGRVWVCLKIGYPQICQLLHVWWSSSLLNGHLGGYTIFKTHICRICAMVKLRRINGLWSTKTGMESNYCSHMFENGASTPKWQCYCHGENDDKPPMATLGSLCFFHSPLGCCLIGDTLLAMTIAFWGTPIHQHLEIHENVTSNNPFSVLFPI